MWDKTIWNTSSFLIVVKYYSINKFYETILIITNKKGHQKLTLLGHSKKNKINIIEAAAIVRQAVSS